MNKLQMLNAIHRRCDKRARQIATDCDLKDKFDEIYTKLVNQEFQELEKACMLNEKLTHLLSKYNIQKENNKLAENWLWITLRPPPEKEKEFNEFKYICEKDYLSRKMFLGGQYCYEQKGDTPESMGKGYHIHILAQCRVGLMKNQVIKDSKSTFRKWLKGEVYDAFVDVDYVRTESDFNRIEMYMSGAKTDDWKDVPCELDPIWRESLGLSSIYQVRDA